MSDLPPGWEWTTLGEVAATSLGKMLDKKQATGLHPTPYLRNINVRWGSFDLSDLAVMDIRPEELDRVLAQPGDVIACEGGEPGRAAVWRGPGTIALQKALHRIQPNAAIDPSYLALLLQHLAVSRKLEPLFTGTTIKHLPQEKLRLVSVPLPPLAEQERIVAAIDEHFSRLDAAEAEVRSARSRVGLLWDRLAMAAVVGSDAWSTYPLSTVLSQTIGGVWGSEHGVEERNVRVLRVTEMDRDGQLDPSTAARRSISAAQLKSRELRVGDLILEKSGGGPNRPVGRVGHVTSVTEPSVCSNFMQLMRPDPALVHPPFLELTLRAFYISGGTEPMQTASTNIRNLKTKEYLAMPIRLPDLPEQVRIAEDVEGKRTATGALKSELTTAIRRAANLRRSILSAAFSGQLVPQDPEDEPASGLLERIRGERTAAASTNQTRKAKAS